MSRQIAATESTGYRFATAFVPHNVIQPIKVATGDALTMPTDASADWRYYGKSGRQYVVISAGGARQSPQHGDYVIAYALPSEPSASGGDN